MKTLFACLLCLLSLQLSAQKKQYNQFYQYGIADAFLAGLYHGTLTVKDMKPHGDFGLGAPDMLDGELMILDGKAYQSRSTGQTTVMADTAKVPLVLSTNFKADTVFYINTPADKKDAFAQINQYLTKANGLYAVRITGEFALVKTRAFPPVTTEPFLPLASMLDKQKFFTTENVKGTLMGFKLPAYLSSVTIAYFHFHFLSADKSKGGHVTDVKVAKVMVEIANLTGMNIEIPQDKYYQNFDFSTVKKGDAIKAETQIK
ncbi:acetolactate decarboxylase [Mucilaginibacter pedocola]|uniref:Alpha-acetolactate decarboxylase n=1 Tax=Mucilaginibacter pedocola TaxID=1792845 RepID=A0A1S9PMH8_9SPHI|nr:acetolactate decarboxylase [Mucilaginibacter pedocola]OOQ62149.1 alpha-acetolactate decarboxylase [Mucilaginibacter pedocola]